MANNNIEQTVKWRLIEDIEQLKQYTGQWQALVQTSQASLFCSPQWIMTWINTYWQPSWQLKVLLAFIDNKLVAIAPLYLQKKTALVPITTLRPLGQGEPEESEVLSEFQDLVIADKSADIYAEFAKKIQQITFVRLVCNNVLASSNWLKVLPLLKNASSKITGKRYLINDKNNYLSTLSKNNRTKWNRCNTKLQQLGAAFSWVPQEHYQEYWQQLIELHQNRWSKKDKLGAFNHPDFTQFHQEFQKHNNTKMSALTIGGETVAINYYLTDHNTLYFYQSGWDESNHAQYSPGFALHIWSIINNPLVNYDFMMGNTSDSYKNSFKCSSQENMCNINIFSHSFINYLYKKFVA